MARIPVDVYEAHVRNLAAAQEVVPSVEVPAAIDIDQMQPLVPPPQEEQPIPRIMPLVQEQETSSIGFLTDLRESKGMKIGLAAATAALAGVAFGFVTTNTQEQSSPSASAASPSNQPKNKPNAASPSPSGSIVQNNPTTQFAKLPSDWQACETPRAKLLTNADLALKVPIKLTNGKEAVVYLANGAMPHVQFSGALAIGACLKADITKQQFVIKDGVVTIPRSVFTTTSMFPAVNTKGSTATEKVDGYAKTGALKADAAKFLSAAEANRINSILMNEGASNIAYRKTADYLVRDGLLTYLTTQNGAAISQRLDASLVAAFIKTNGKKVKYVLTGQYDGLNVHYEATVAKDFTPIKDVQANGPISGGATIVNVEKQS